MTQAMTFYVDFFFEPGAGVFLWMCDPEDAVVWGGNPLDLAALPVSDGLRTELERLGDWHETSYGDGYQGPGPWRQNECDRFNAAAAKIVVRLLDELGPGWDLARRFPDIQEEPQ